MVILRYLCTLPRVMVIFAIFLYSTSMSARTPEITAGSTFYFFRSYKCQSMVHFLSSMILFMTNQSYSFLWLLSMGIGTPKLLRYSKRSKPRTTDRQVHRRRQTAKWGIRKSQSIGIQGAYLAVDKKHTSCGRRTDVSPTGGRCPSVIKDDHWSSATNNTTPHRIG